MSIYVIGINHKTACLSLREKAYFAVDQLGFYLRDLLAMGIAQEAVLISTCNRSEIYCTSDQLSAVHNWFCNQTALTREEVEPLIYIYEDTAAISHIMRVACGLDSMVLGEPQILGQMKEAFLESCGAGGVDSTFHKLFQRVFAVAKEIRTTTSIGACPVSVASAATHFVKDNYADVSQAAILLIGAGDTTNLILPYLKNLQCQHISLLTRSLENISLVLQGAAQKIYSSHELETALQVADVVITATSSVQPIITATMMRTVLAARNQRPIFLLDLAVPRDVEAAVTEIPGINAFCIDDLKKIIEKNRLGREHAAIKAQECIADESAALFNEFKSLADVNNTIRRYRHQVENICQRELQKAVQQLQSGAPAKDVLTNFANAYTQKVLHMPSVQMRQAGAEGRVDFLNVIKQLFALSDAEHSELT